MRFAVEPLPLKKPLFPSDQINRFILDLRKEVNYIKGNIENLPFISHQFDIVIISNVLDYVMNPFEGMMEVRRVLKKNGYLICAQDVHSFVGLLKMKVRHDWVAEAHPWRFTRQSFKRLLRKTGFKIIDIIGDETGISLLINNVFGKLKRILYIAVPI